MRHNVFPLAVVCALLAACTTPTPPPGRASNPPEAGIETAGQLTRHHWLLSGATNAAGQRITVLADKPGKPLQLEFKDGRLGVGNGCNMMGGAYSVRGAVLTVGDMQSTLMACEDNRLMSADSAIAQRLAKPVQIAIADGGLTLTAANGDVLMFTAVP